MPDSVLPERRKRQTYISGILSGNEVGRDSAYNRKLFKRIKRGHYIINPLLKLREEDQWVSVHDLLKLDDLDFKPAVVADYDIRPEYRNSFLQRLDNQNTIRSENVRYFCGEIQKLLTEDERCYLFRKPEYSQYQPPITGQNNNHILI